MIGEDLTAYYQRRSITKRLCWEIRIRLSLDHDPSEVARSLGVSIHVVSAVWGDPLQHQWSEAEVCLLLEFRRRGMGFGEIGERLGRSAEAVGKKHRRIGNSEL